MYHQFSRRYRFQLLHLLYHCRHKDKWSILGCWPENSRSMLGKTLIGWLRNMLLRCSYQIHQQPTQYSRCRFNKHHQDNRRFSRFNSRTCNIHQLGWGRLTIGKGSTLWLKLSLSTWFIMFSRINLFWLKLFLNIWCATYNRISRITREVIWTTSTSLHHIMSNISKEDHLSPNLLLSLISSSWYSNRCKEYLSRGLGPIRLQM